MDHWCDSRRGASPRDVATPGYVEMDVEHHCNRYAGGEYAHPPHLVDVTGGWSGNVLATLLPSCPMYTPTLPKQGTCSSLTFLPDWTWADVRNLWSREGFASRLVPV